MSELTYNQLLNTKGLDWILVNLSKEDLVRVIKNPNTTFCIDETTCCICYDTPTNPYCCKRCKEGVVCGKCYKQLTKKSCPICRKKF